MRKIKPFITGVNLIIIVVLVNILLSFYPFLKIDLSRDKIHSLSPSTADYIRKIDDIITIKVFLTEDLPPEVKPTADKLKTILSEFERLNRSKLKINYFNPNTDEQAGSEAERFGIQPIQFSSLKSDKFEMQKGYFGLAMIYGDNQQVLPIAGDVANLEYFLVSGFRKLVSDKIPTVAIAEGQEEEESEISYFRQFLMQDYKLVMADLDSKDGIPEEADILIITDRTTKINEEVIPKIQKWVEEGKGLIVFQDKIEVSNSMSGKTLENNGLEDILSDSGMEIENKLILDESSAIANFQSQQGSFLSRYPYWMQIRPENMNKDIPALSGINSVTLAWASPIKMSGGAKALFTSSELSKAEDSNVDLSPAVKYDFKPSEKSIIGALNVDDRKVALIADTDFIKDKFMVNNQQNLLLALNLVEYFSQDQSLLAIRSKDLNSNPLSPIEDGTKQLIKIVNIAFPVVLLIATSLIINTARKKSGRKWNNA